MRGGWRERKRDREGCGGDKNNNMNFSLLSSMDFPPHQISVGPDETKVIRETQAGHLTAITGTRPHCLWSKANTASLVRKVGEKSPFLFFLISCVSAVEYCTILPSEMSLTGLPVKGPVMKLMVLWFILSCHFFFSYFNIPQRRDEPVKVSHCAWVSKGDNDGQWQHLSFLIP